MEPISTGLVATGATAAGINLAGQLTNGIMGFVNNKWNKNVVERQLKMQEENNAYQKYFSENSAQIRAKDLEKAGLSKTLAAGSSAVNPTLQSSPSAHVPEASGFGDMNMAENINRAVELSNAIGVSAYNNDLAQSQAELNREHKKDVHERRSVFNQDAKYWHSVGLPTNFNMVNKYTAGLAALMNAARMKDGLKDALKKGTAGVSELGNYTKQLGADLDDSFGKLFYSILGEDPEQYARDKEAARHRKQEYFYDTPKQQNNGYFDYYPK